MKSAFQCVYFVLGLVLWGCNDDWVDKGVPDQKIAEDAPYVFEIPGNFPALQQDLSLNPPTKNGVYLGRKLFQENKLSKNNTISCAFCHEQRHAFTHHGHRLSHGIHNLVGKRNTPAVQNMAFQSEYFYDGASNSIQMLSIVPIHNEVEMGENLSDIPEKLRQDPEYVRLFAAAFKDGKISSVHILNALAQFMSVLISSDSKYDKYVRKERGGAFSTQELKGLDLFKKNCASCHATDLFTDHSFRNNGLPIHPNLKDLGRETVTGFPSDRYKFKVPSLRNVALTAPYMHDGRFGSLISVLHFYSDGVQHTENLDPLLQQHGTLGIPLNQEEKDAIIAFLKTLTDHQFIKNPSFKHKT